MDIDILIFGATAFAAFSGKANAEPVFDGGFSPDEYTYAQPTSDFSTADYSTQNLSAFLMTIRTCEGTADDGGYSRLFGGDSFNGFSDHPRIVVIAGTYKSSAAGAYQILQATWDTVIQPALHLPDFSPTSQDAAAVYLIQRRGAYDDVLAGRFDSAISKCGKEWASLPGSPYGQPVKTLAFVRNTFSAYGGSIA